MVLDNIGLFLDSISVKIIQIKNIIRNFYDFITHFGTTFSLISPCNGNHSFGSLPQISSKVNYSVSFIYIFAIPAHFQKSNDNILFPAV